MSDRRFIEESFPVLLERALTEAGWEKGTWETLAEAGEEGLC